MARLVLASLLDRPHHLANRHIPTRLRAIYGRDVSRHKVPIFVWLARLPAVPLSDLEADPRTSAACGLTSSYLGPVHPDHATGCRLPQSARATVNANLLTAPAFARSAVGQKLLTLVLFANNFPKLTVINLQRFAIGHP